MGKKSLTKSTAKKKKTTEKKPSVKDADIAVESTPKPDKTAAEPAAVAEKRKPAAKKPTIKTLLKKDFGTWNPPALFSAASDAAIANYTAPPFVDAADPAEAAAIRALLAKQFDLTVVESADTTEKPAKPAKKKAAPAKEAAPKPAVPAEKPVEKKVTKPVLSVAELLNLKFDPWRPETLFTPTVDPRQQAAYTAPAVVDTDRPDAANIKALLAKQFDLSVVEPGESPAPAEPVSAPEIPVPEIPATSPEPPEETAEPVMAGPASPETPVPAPIEAATEPAAQAVEPDATPAPPEAMPEPIAEPGPAPEPVKAPEPEPVKEAEKPAPAAKEPVAAVETPKMVEEKTPAPKPEEPPKAPEKPKAEAKKETSPKAPDKPAPQPAADKTPEPTVPVAPPKPPETASGPMKMLIVCVAAVFALLMIASAMNTGKYYLNPVENALEIRQGTFSPSGKALIATIPGAAAPEPVKSVYSKKEALAPAYDHYMKQAEILSHKKGWQDFDAIRGHLYKAIRFAPTLDLRDKAKSLLHRIDAVLLIEAAEISAAKGTLAGYESAINDLNQAKNMGIEESQRALVDQKLETIKKAKKLLEGISTAPSKVAGPQPH